MKRRRCVCTPLLLRQLSTMPQKRIASVRYISPILRASALTAATVLASAFEDSSPSFDTTPKGVTATG